MLESSVPTNQMIFESLWTNRLWFDVKPRLYFALWVQKFLACTKMFFSKPTRHESLKLVSEALTWSYWCALDIQIVFKPGTYKRETKKIHNHIIIEKKRLGQSAWKRKKKILAFVKGAATGNHPKMTPNREVPGLNTIWISKAHQYDHVNASETNLRLSCLVGFEKNILVHARNFCTHKPKNF